MLYFIGLKLPYDLKEEVKRLHRFLGVGSHTSAPPHITLIPSFVLEENEDFIIKKLSSLFQGMANFEVEIRGINFFENGENSNVVHVDVVDSDILVNLRDNLCDVLRNRVRNEIMVRTSDLHITISRKLNLNEFNKCIEKLKDYHLELEHKFIVNEVYLFRIKSNEPWEEFRKFRLSPILKKEPKI